MSAMTPDATDSNAEATGLSSLKQQSLKAAGYGYLVGDAALFAAGIMEKNFKGASTGLLWGLGGLAAARYGNPKAEKQLSILTRKLGDYLEKQGISIPDIAEKPALIHKEGIIEHIESFLYAHPSEALNAVYALGAGQLLASGIQKKFTADITSGALIGAGALAGLLIPERKPDPEHPTHGALGKALSWVQEKPLRLSGALYHVNNVSMVWAGFAKRKENPANKSYMLRFATAGSYILANTLLSLSSKGGGDDKKSTMMAQKLADTAAQVVAAQPPEVQQALVEQVAGYLSAQPELHKTAPQISALMQEKLAGLKEKLPVAGEDDAPAAGWVARTQAQPTGEAGRMA
jgi:hypothetical protein